MQPINKIKNLKGKTVILRADFNVPMQESKIKDTFRIDSAHKTINFLKNKGAKVVVMSHLGDDGSKSLISVAKYLNRKVKTKFCMANDMDQITSEIMKLKSGEVLLLDNIRKFAGEKENDTNLAKRFAKLADVYVNDAFSVSHRAHMSIVGIPKHLPAYAGFQIMDEIKHLSIAHKPKHPFIFILGGAKFSTKMPLVKKFLKDADCVFIGGALMNSFFKAKGYEVGLSKVDDTDPKVLKSFMKNTKLCLPVDVVVRDKSGNVRICDANLVSSNETIVDIGPKSVKLLGPMLSKAKLVLWNGPMGFYEDGFDKATKDILKILMGIKGQTIIGGGDTAEIINKMKVADKFTFVSTGGGATLDFLASGTLAGIKALK